MKNEAWRSGKALITSVAALGAVMVLLGLAYLAQTNYRKRVILQTKQQLLTTAKTMAAGIEEYIVEHQRNPEAISKNPAVQEMTFRSALIRRPPETYCVCQSLYEAHKDHVDAFTVLDGNGIMLRRVPHIDDRIGRDHTDKPGVAYVLKEQRPYISEVFINNLGNRAISILHPITSQGGFSGIARWMIQVDTISRRFLEGVKIGESGCVILLDDRGRLLYHSKHKFEDENSAENSETKTVDISPHPCLNLDGLMEHYFSSGESTAVLGGQDGPKGAEEVKRIVACTPVRVGEGNWIVGTILPYEEVSGPIFTYARNTWALAGVAALIFGAGSLSLVRTQRQRAQVEAEAKYFKQLAESAEALRRSEEKAHRMEVISTLAGGIAHEFNNALVGISGNIDLLEMTLASDENVTRPLSGMRDAARRMTGLTDQLLAYARGGKYQPRIMSLNKLLETTVPVVKHRIDPRVALETDLKDDMADVEVDLTQMQMVLLAILHNASEAMEGEGRIRIGTREISVDQGFESTELNMKHGRYVRLSVADTGRGMDEETRAKMFEPFFSTKFQGRGLGMAAVYGIVKNHGGYIEVQSELGKGTEVKIYLPAGPREA